MYKKYITINLCFYRNNDNVIIVFQECLDHQYYFITIACHNNITSYKYYIQKTRHLINPNIFIHMITFVMLTHKKYIILVIEITVSEYME